MLPNNRLQEWWAQLGVANNVNTSEWAELYRTLFRYNPSDVDIGTVLVKTETGSIYEFKPSEQMVRRVFGTRAPTENQGDDGNWKRYSFLTIYGYPPYVQCLIGWNSDGSKTTLTSAIKIISNRGIVANNEAVYQPV